MDIENIKQNAIKEYLYKLYDGKYKHEYIDKQYNIIKSSLLKGIPKDFNEQHGVTNSKNINNDTIEIFYSLLAIYKYIDILDDKLNSKTNQRMSNILNLKNRILKFKSKQKYYDFLIKSKSNPVILKDDFDNNSFVEKDNKWLSERYGEEVDHVLSNVYDGKTNTMQLPKTTECNEAISDNIISATVSNNNLYANYDIMHNDINNILYENNVPFVFNILSNKEVNINNEVNKIGATIEIIINFEYCSMVNELVISPISKYPMKINKIVASLGSDNTDIVYEGNTNTSLTPKILYNPVSYKFKNTKVTSIHVFVSQIHCERENFIFNEEDYLLNTLLNNTINTNEMFNIYNLKDKYSNIIGYNYEFAFKYLIPYRNEFEKCGIYVTREINICNSIKEIKINTDQNNATNSLNYVCTDIEYYINFTNNNNHDNWIPILPTNYNNVVDNELLQVYDDLCYLRFEAKNIYQVSRDGNIIEENVDYYLKVNSKGNVYAIEIPDYDFNSIYTVKYNAINGSDVIKLNNEYITTTQTFNGNDKTVFSLDYIVLKPFKKDYINIEITKDMNILYSSDTNIECVENDIDNSLSYANFKKNTTDLQYYVDNNKLYFNRPLQNDWVLKVTYKHEPNSFRFKAILRRNSKYDKHLTPELNGIVYIIKTK